MQKIESITHMEALKLCQGKLPGPSREKLCPHGNGHVWVGRDNLGWRKMHTAWRLVEGRAVLGP